MRQLIIGMITEGKTDVRFLESIIKRTFESVAFECTGDIEILDIQKIQVTKSTFKDEVMEAAIKGWENYGISTLCVHTDADDVSDGAVFQNKISPAFEAVKNSKQDICKVLVPVVPVQMTEAWMLADTVLFKEEIGTEKSNNELGIHLPPEHITNPKQTIKDAIRIALAHLPSRRRRLKISELYLPIGQKINLQQLGNIPSYAKFKSEVRAALRDLNLLYDKTSEQ